MSIVDQMNPAFVQVFIKKLQVLSDRSKKENRITLSSDISTEIVYLEKFDVYANDDIKMLILQIIDGVIILYMNLF